MTSTPFCLDFNDFSSDFVLLRPLISFCLDYFLHSSLEVLSLSCTAYQCICTYSFSISTFITNMNALICTNTNTLIQIFLFHGQTLLENQAKQPCNGDNIKQLLFSLLKFRLFKLIISQIKTINPMLQSLFEIKFISNTLCEKIHCVKNLFFPPQKVLLAYSFREWKQSSDCRIGFFALSPRYSLQYFNVLNVHVYTFFYKNQKDIAGVCQSMCLFTHVYLYEEYFSYCTSHQ